MNARKKTIVSVAVIIAIICGLIWVYHPISFYDSFEQISIAYFESRFGADGEPSTYTADFLFTPQDAEFHQIKAILGGNAFHRTPTSFFRGNMYWEGPGRHLICSLISVSESYFQSFHLAPTPFISIDSSKSTGVYRIGYWGNSRVLAMIDDISAILPIDNH